MNAPQTTYELLYNGRAITADVLPWLNGFTYTDKESGESDELEVNFSDADALWRGEWQPAKGDTIEASIFKGGGVLQCGLFTVDELVYSGGKSSGRNFSIKALAAGITNQVRTKTSFAHENKTLTEIVNTVAAKHGFRVLGDIKPIPIGRITQYRKSDLAFLQQLAQRFGYAFSIRDKQMIFADMYQLEAAQPGLVLKESDLAGWSITDKSTKTYTAAKLKHFSSREKKVVEHGETETKFLRNKKDVLEIRARAENKQQAEMIAKAALHRANSFQQAGTITTEGNTLLLAGAVVGLENMGRISGRYYITQSTHTVTKSAAYTTEAEVKKVG